LTAPVRFAVIGRPLAHSLSALIHQEAFRRLGMPATYERIEMDPGSVAAFLDRAAREGFRGLNVTIPLKEEALGAARTVSAEARDIGAANVLSFDGEAWRAHNTDARAFRSTLPKGIEAALVLGAGGAGRACIFALCQDRRRVFVSARSTARARRVAAAFGVEMVPWEDRHAAVRDVDLVVNATPVGTHGEGSPLDTLEGATERLVLYDLVYRPPVTPFLAMGAAGGFETVGGAAMLAAQAALSWGPWFGVTGPKAFFEARLRRQLKTEGE